MTIGFLDSGVETGHECLGSALLPGGFRDAVDGADGAPWDRSGHGTRVASLALGRHLRWPVGIAPGARMAAAAVTLSDDTVWTHLTLAGLSWMLEQAHTLRVLNISLAMTPHPDVGPLLSALEDRGVLVIAAAQGADAAASWPGALLAGAVDQRGVPDRPSAAALAASPDACVLAPGTRVLAARPFEPDAYEVASGTSMAAAVVSGVAAQIAQRYPELTPAELRRALREGSRRGTLSAPAALEAASTTRA